ncbi:uncharacterized protein J5F26_012570 isoform 4-T4 [Ciconia maguari]
MGWALLGAGLLLALYTLLRHGLRRVPPPRARTALGGRTAIVTGGSGGIGAATALELARCGARVVLAARSVPRGEAAARRIRTETGNAEVRFMQLDLASLRSVRAFASAFLRQEPHLHLLINNAGEPPGPFPAHPAAAGAAAELRAQPRGHRRLPRPLRRPPAPRHPGPPAPRTAIDLPGLLRQQAGQRAARPRAGHAPAGHPGDVLRRAPRVRQHGALPPHAALAEAALPAAGLALLPRRSRGRPDLPALRHAGRPRVLQRPLLRRLPPAGAVAAGPRRPAGPGALGGQREAGGAGGDRGEPLASPHRFWTIKVTVTKGRRPPSAPARPRVGMGAKWSSPRQSAARAGAALDLGGSGHVCAAGLASCSSTAGSLGLRCPPRNGRACLPSPARTRAQAMQCAPPYPCSKAAALPCKGTHTLQRSTPCLARACTRCSTHAPCLAHAAVQKPRLARACTQPPVPQRARPACTHLALHGNAHAAVCTPCLARPSHAHAAVRMPCLAGPCTRCSVRTLPCTPMHTLQHTRPALHTHARAAVRTRAPHVTARARAQTRGTQHGGGGAVSAPPPGCGAAPL